MNMSRLYPLIFCSYLLLTGCVFDIALPDEGSGPVPVPDEEKVAVSFSSSMDLSTKADAVSLADGVLADVYAYQQNTVATPAVTALVSRHYVVSGGNGSMEVTGGESIMYLSAGNYTFYALSVNANAAPPGLAAGSFSETGQLNNNTDYIYCATNTPIDSKPGETQAVSLSFRRLSTRFVLQIVSESSGDDQATAADAPSLLLAATNPSGLKITLGATEILPSGTPVSNKNEYTTLQSTGTLTEGFTASCIMLPMQGGKTIPVTVTFPGITFNGLVQTNKIYTLEITTPEGGFTSGNQYNYRVNITGNDIVFKGVSVRPWTGKDGSLSDEDVTEDW